MMILRAETEVLYWPRHSPGQFQSKVSVQRLSFRGLSGIFLNVNAICNLIWKLDLRCNSSLWLWCHHSFPNGAFWLVNSCWEIKFNFTSHFHYIQMENKVWFSNQRSKSRSKLRFIILSSSRVYLTDNKWQVYSKIYTSSLHKCSIKSHAWN